MAKLCVALGLCAAAAFFSLSQFATRRGRQGDDVRALCTWLTSSTVPERVRQWALTSPLLNCAALLSQQQAVSSTPFVDTSSEEDRYETVFPTTTEFPTEPWSLSYEEFTSTRVQEEPEEEMTTVLSSKPAVMELENEQTTYTEASTQSFADSSISYSDASTSTHAIPVPSHIEEYQTGWSGKATHSEAVLTVERKGGTQESFAEDSLIRNPDPRTTDYLTVADKNAEPKQEGLTPKAATTADQNQDRQSTLSTVLPLQSSNGAHREITTFSFSNLAFAPQQESTNEMATTEFEVKPTEDDRSNTFSSVHVATGEDHVTNEFIASEAPYLDTEQRETQSTINPVLFPHTSQDDQQRSSTPTTAFELDMDDKTTSLPVVLSSTLSETEREAYVSVSMFDQPSQLSTELSWASKPSTNLDAQVEEQTTPLLRDKVSEDQDENIATPDFESRHLAQQPEPDVTTPYDFIQSHSESDIRESTSNLPSYTSPVQSPSRIITAASDILSKSEYYTTPPLPEFPSNSIELHGANQTASDTPAPADEAVENTTDRLTSESKEVRSRASVSLLEHSSSFNQLGDTTAVIASTLANVEKATTTEPTPEEPEGPKVVCYFPTWSFFRQGRGHYTPEDIDPHLCTHIIYGFTSLDSDSLHLANASEIIADAKFHLRNRTLALKTVNRRLKVLLALGGWYHGIGEGDKCSTFASNATARRRFAHHAAAFVAKHRLDGLNVDWASFSGGECEDVPDKRNFVLLLQDIREAFDAYDPPLLLTAAIAGNVDVIRKAYDVAEIFNQTDFTSVMAYDYFGTESPVVAHYSPLQSATDETNPEMSIEYVLNTLISMGAPLEKLVLGVPFYARSYTLANPRLNYIGAPAKGKGDPGPVTATPGVLAYYEVRIKYAAPIKAGGWTTMMDKRAGVYAYSGDQWVCFDGPRSLMRKARFALKMGLAGLMASDVSMDDFRGECGRKSPLLNAIHRVFYPQTTTALAKG
ncbi:hypothetical protein MTO96_003254 [Rhipicephalus appendiculatus]